MRAVVYLWLDGFRQLCQSALGVNEVYPAHESVRVKYLLDVWAYLVAEYGQDAHNLTSLLRFQLADTVVGLHNFSGLDEDGLSCGRLIVYDTVDASLHARRYRYHQSAVAHCWSGILVHQSVALS